MAKIETYSNRGTTLVDGEPDDSFHRPAPSSRSRADRDFASDRPSARLGEGAGSRAEDDEPFLRTRRRVPVRKGMLPDWATTRWGRILLVAAAAVVVAGVVTLVLFVRNFLDRDPRFRIDTAESIQTMGNSQLTREDLLAVFGSDIGRNVFFVPLAARRTELEHIPWVEHATVMRLLPNQLRVAVRERTPVAFVREGDQIKLVDGAGVILDMPPSMMAAKHFSFPVVAGINPNDPLSARGPRMRLYQKFLTDIDGGGEKISSELSEVDLTDAEDVRATLPAKSSDIVLHFGDEKFLTRYRTYQAHLAEWQQQYPHLASVDLRYDTQVVLKMADGSPAETAGPVVAQPAAPTDAPAPAKHPAAKRHPSPAEAKKHAGKAKR